MEPEVVPTATLPVLEYEAGIEHVGDALDIIGSCSGHDTDRVLLHSSALPADFFDLSTRFAGEFLQKLVNYRVRVAGLFEEREGYSERFREFLYEAGRGQQFRAFETRAEALAWLEAGDS